MGELNLLAGPLYLRLDALVDAVVPPTLQRAMRVFWRCPDASAGAVPKRSAIRWKQRIWKRLRGVHTDAQLRRFLLNEARLAEVKMIWLYASRVQQRIGHTDMHAPEYAALKKALGRKPTVIRMVRIELAEPEYF